MSYVEVDARLFVDALEDAKGPRICFYRVNKAGLAVGLSVAIVELAKCLCPIFLGVLGDLGGSSFQFE